MARSKRYKELRDSFDGKKAYSPEEAIKLAKSTSKVKFDAAVEVHINLGIDPKKSDQQVRSTVTLPHGTGKTKRIAVFCGSPEKSKEATEAGADLVGGEELIAEIAKTNKIDFDIAIATPDMMPKLAKVAKLLGPRGLMPSPKNETVTPNIEKAVKALKGGRVAYKNDDTGNIHQSIGRASFSEQQLLENYTTFMEAVRRVKPPSSKGVYLKRVTLTSTMGPAIKVEA
jgi:large subunit ribosomal protein L1